MKGIKLVHMNVRSLINKKQEIMSTYGFCDVIVITETWLNASVPDSAVMIPNYILIRQDRHMTDMRKGGGICIYVKDKYVVDHMTEISEVSKDYEILSLRIKFNDIKPCYIIGTYRPPKGKPGTMIDKLSNIIENLDLNRSELYLMGDLNIDYSSNDIIKKHKIKIFESKHNITQLIKTVTRLTETTSTTLDWIYVSTDNIADHGTINHNMSDQFPIFVVRKKKRNKIVKKMVEGRSYLRYDTDRFQQLLSDKDWSAYDNNDIDVDKLWELFESNIRQVLDQICPIKKLSVPESTPKWMNNEILVLMRKRDAMYKKARRNNDIVLWRKAKFLRNRVEMLIKNYKKEKIEEELIRNRNRPKQFWASIREIWPKGSNANIYSLSDNEGTVLADDNEIADHINDHFANIGNTLAQNIQAQIGIQETTRLYHTAMNNNNDNITNVPITRDEFLEILNNVDVNKSSSMDNIRTMVIIDAFTAQLDRVLKLYNGSLTRCIFPTPWKEGTVIPLPKISIPKTALDLRPISLLPLSGKILEHIISKRLKLYMAEHNILTDKQHGFRKNRSTLSAITQFLHTIYNYLNMGYDSYIVYLDLKKAFDTVCHKKNNK